MQEQRHLVRVILALRLASVLAWLAIVLLARFRRPQFRYFAGIVLGIHTLVAVELFPEVPRVLLAPVLVLHTFVYLQFARLLRPALRPAWYRWFISVPGSYFAAATFLAFPWAIVRALGVTPHGLWIPYALTALGVLESLIPRKEVVSIVTDRSSLGSRVERWRSPKAPASRAPLRIVQITDTHLGPFMSVERLRGIVARAVAQDPDLIALTGDFLTLESQQSAEPLKQALAPLRDFQKPVLACLGNHDQETPQLVREALASANVQLLVDESCLLETSAGPVQVLGLDFTWRERAERIRAACARHPRIAGALRLVLLHDPGAFKHLPEGEGDLVLSGHTHGGQIGLVSLGLPWTIIRLFVDMPDHGLWARGPDRLYVHKGTGHYGFPVRVGVPSEESVLHVYAS